MMQPPITALLRGQLDQMGATKRRLAQVILDDPGRVSRMSIQALAEAAGVSQASVTRFCRSLELDGYAQLRLALAAESVRGEPVPAEGDIAEGDDLASVVSKIVRLDAQAVTDTAQVMSLATLELAIDALSRARRIDVYGVGASAIVGADLAQKLTRIGRSCVAYGDAHLGLTSAALLGPDDAVVAVSHSGTTADTLDMVRTAKAGGAATIAVTNDPHSELASTVDHVLLTAAQESVFRSGATASRLAQLLVVDCMFVGLAQRTFQASQLALESTWRAVRHRANR